MSILNRPTDGLLSVLLALGRTLRAYGTMSEERLQALCAPRSIVGDEKQSTLQVHKTLNRWKQLGFFVIDGGVDHKVSLAPPFDELDLEDIEAIKPPLLELVLRSANNPIDGRDPDIESGDSSDFSLACAWTLQQDPYSFPTNWPGIQKLQTDEAVTLPFFSNSTRWDGLVEWAPFLGLARMDALLGLIPNPVHAVRAVVPTLFEGTSALPIQDCLAALAALVPVLDHGVYWRAALARIGTPWLTLGSSDVSPCLSLALLQLDRERRVQLDHRSDARVVYRLLGRGGRELRQVTHVALVEARP